MHRAGVNDLGGTLMTRTSRGRPGVPRQELDEAELREVVEGLGRSLVQRTTLYGARRPRGGACGPSRSAPLAGARAPAVRSAPAPPSVGH